MGLGNLQYYFPTRDDLLEAVIEVEFEYNLKTMRALDQRATSLGDYVEQLARLLLREYTGRGGNIWSALSMLHLHNRRFRRLSENVYREHFDVIVIALRKFGVAGSASVLLQKARLITALIDGASLQAHAGPHSRNSSSWRSFCRKTAETAVAVANA